MSSLKPGWPGKVTAYLARQVEPISLKKVAAEALGLESSVLTKGEHSALSRVIYNHGWRSYLFWCPPAHDGPWSPEAEAA